MLSSRSPLVLFGRLAPELPRATWSLPNPERCVFNPIFSKRTLTAAASRQFSHFSHLRRNRRYCRKSRFAPLAAAASRKKNEILQNPTGKTKINWDQKFEKCRLAAAASRKSQASILSVAWVSFCLPLLYPHVLYPLISILGRAAAARAHSATLVHLQNIPVSPKSNFTHAICKTPKPIFVGNQIFRA